MSADPVELTWSMKADGHALHVAYTLANHSDQPVYVFDCLLAPGSKSGTYKRVPGKAVVMESEPGVAGIFLGAASPDMPLAWLVPPLVKPLAAGASASGTIELPLPLVAWHNLAWVRPLAGAPAKAALHVQVFLGEPGWLELPSESGETLKVPKSGDSRTLSSTTQPIPKP